MFILFSISTAALAMMLLAAPLAKALGLDAQFIAQVVGFFSVQGLALFWVGRFVREHGLTWAQAFGLPDRPGRSLGLAALVMLPVIPFATAGIGRLMNWLLQLCGVTPEAQAAITMLQMDMAAWQLALLGFAAVFLAPLAEELLFRGILYTWIKQRGHPRLALWGTSVLFGLIHVNLMALPSLCFLGLVFALLYERTQNLLAPITAHILFNAVNFAAVVLDFPGWLEKISKP